MKSYFGFLSLSLFLAVMGTTVAQAVTADQYVAAGNQNYTAKDYAKAVQYYQAAIQMNPNSAAAYQGLGNSNYQLGNKSAALTAYEKAITLNPSNTQLSAFVQSMKNQGVVDTAAAGSTPASSTVPNPAASYSNSPAVGKFELAPHAGIAYSTSTGYGIGFGGGLSGYFPSGGGLAFGGTAAFYTFGGPSYVYSGTTISQSFSNIEVLAALKYRLGTGSVRPYLVAGGGLSLLSVTSSANIAGYGGASGSTSTTNPMIQGGGGIEFPAGASMNVFVEGKASIVIGNGGTVTYLPIEGG
ncbi:MAG TPA: tetratricopeptide repeat protein, partial [bacterium]